MLDLCLDGMRTPLALSPAIIGLLGPNCLLVRGSCGHWNRSLLVWIWWGIRVWPKPFLWHLEWITFAFLEKWMNSGSNVVVLGWDVILQFSHWISDILQSSLYLWKFLPFFFNFALGSNTIEPLDFCVIYKIVLGFSFNQLSS